MSKDVSEWNQNNVYDSAIAERDRLRKLIEASQKDLIRIEQWLQTYAHFAEKARGG